MLTHTSYYPIKASQLQALSVLDLSAADTICLDIETTGLIPSVCAVFMIGCAIIRNNQLCITQWMADGLTWDDEADVLKAFTTYLNENKPLTSPLHLLTYNGDRFDLRFLKERFMQCRLSDPLNDPSILTVDLMTAFKPLKKLYNLQNMKLKTLAAFMAVPANKTPEGKALINRYHDYIKTKDPETLDLLWQHNMNDLYQTIGILPLSHTLAILDGQFDVMKAYLSQEKLFIEASAEYGAAAPLDLSYEDLHLHMNDTRLTFEIPLCERGFRYFYTDLKNYVYLPKEDFVIPKTMAAYVPAADKCKASKTTCYTWFYPDETFLEDRDKLNAYAKMLSAFLVFIR